MSEQIITFATRFFSWNFYSADLSFLLCTVVLLGYFDRKPRTIALRLRDYAVLLVVEALLCCAKYLITGDSGSLPVLMVMLVAYALFQKRIRTTDKIVRCATLAASNILLIGITGVLAISLGLSEDNPLRWFMPNIGSFLILFAITLFVKRFAVSRFRFVPRGYAYLVVTVCIISSVIGWFLLQNNLPAQDALESLPIAERDLAMREPARVNLVVNIGFLALVLISYRLFYLLSAEHETRAERLITKRSADDNAEMIGVTKSVYESMREMRHEAKNRMAYMESLAKAEDWERLSEYISASAEQSSQVLNYVQSGNSTIDAVVNAKIALANTQGIEVKTMLAVPAELGYAEEDLYALIANLMDNAIEGAAASEAEEKVIRLSIRPEGGYYIVSVQNPCAPRKDGSGSLSRLKTTKADKEVHGYGTKLISRIAKRFNGTARYQVKDNVFTVNVMLTQAGADSGEEGAE